MKKLKLAIIGQGRSGKDIHGSYYLREDNRYYEVKFVVDADARRREISAERYPGCTVFADYTELFAHKDEIDLVVNSTYSHTHYSITLDLLEHGFNVLCEKPMAKTAYEADTLIKTAKEKGVKLAVFHQSLYATYVKKALEIRDSGIIGEIKQISLAFSGFSRRWDWQTLQKRVAGNTYNTGPHPISIALTLLDYDKNTRVAYSKLDRTEMTSGDADDFAKIILDTPDKPLVDIEINSSDAYPGANLKLIGSKGTFKTNIGAYSMKYIVDGENVARPVQEDFLCDENSKPLYCSETLVSHEISEKLVGNAFDVGTSSLYEELYYLITEDRPMTYTPENARDVVAVIETAHAQNRLELLYL